MSSDDTQLAGDLAMTVVRFARYLRLRRRETSTLSLSQLSALTVLHRDGPMTPGTLAVAERITPPSMTRVLDTLDRAGYVTRHPHPTDGRNIIVSLTPLGTDTVLTDADARHHWLRDQLETLTPDQLATLRDAAHAIETILANDDDPD